MVVQIIFTITEFVSANISWSYENGEGVRKEWNMRVQVQITYFLVFYFILLWKLH